MDNLALIEAFGDFKEIKIRTSFQMTFKLTLSETRIVNQNSENFIFCIDFY